jgi:hypothetical protein
MWLASQAPPILEEHLATFSRPGPAPAWLRCAADDLVCEVRRKLLTDDYPVTGPRSGKTSAIQKLVRSKGASSSTFAHCSVVPVCPLT